MIQAKDTLFARPGGKIVPVLDELGAIVRYETLASDFPEALLRLEESWDDSKPLPTTLKMTVVKANPTTFYAGTQVWLATETLRKYRRVEKVQLEPSLAEKVKRAKK